MFTAFYTYSNIAKNLERFYTTAISLIHIVPKKKNKTLVYVLLLMVFRRPLKNFTIQMLFYKLYCHSFC